jgi:maleylpyruvate isomerase
MTASGRPSDELLWARRGTAAFLRAVSRLTDEQMYAEVEGHQRSLIVAEACYRARGYARLAEEIRQGVPSPRAFDDDDEFTAAVTQGASLPPRALRHLVEHSSIHLRVEWRDLPDASWDVAGRWPGGRELTPRACVRARVRETWLGSIELTVDPGLRLPLPPAVRPLIEAEALAG